MINNKDMESFSTFYYESIVTEETSLITNPHHRTDSRLITRGLNITGGSNIIANRYKKGDPNYKEKLPVGPIGLPTAYGIISKYGLNKDTVDSSPTGVQLRKSNYLILKTKSGYVIRKVVG